MPRPMPISASRPRLAQIGAWASKQSSQLESRLAFEMAIAQVTARYPIGTILEAALLVRLSRCTHIDGVLARPAIPAA